MHFIPIRQIHAGGVADTREDAYAPALAPAGVLLSMDVFAPAHSCLYSTGMLGDTATVRAPANGPRRAR